MKKTRKISTYILVFILSFLLFPIQVIASIITIYSQNIKAESSFLMESDVDMDTNSVLVTLTLNETKKLKEYSPSDFKDIGCIAVEDLTKNIFEYAKSQKFKPTEHRKSLVNLDNFKRILKLTLDIKNKKNIINVINSLNKRKNIDLVTPNYIHTNNFESSIPNDEYYTNGNMWGLNGTYGIQAEQIWNYAIGNSMITIGILDSGIDADHPDLIGHINTQGLHRDCTHSPPTNEYHDTLFDNDGHGTHVAGTIGAHTNNIIGTNGICWHTNLVSLRVFGDNGYGDISSLVRAIDYATTANIPILNFSGGTPEYVSSLSNILNLYNGLFICAAGNTSQNNDELSYYPSNFSFGESYSDRIISVGNLSQTGGRRFSSNYGQNSVSIYAPGENILSTFPSDICENVCSKDDAFLTDLELDIKSDHYSNGYHYMSGTSMAAPHVTGVAALLLSYNPDLTAEQLKTAITYGSDTITISTPSGEQSVKKLNAFKALKYVMRYYGKNTTLKFNDKTLSKEVDSNSAYFNKSHYMLALDVDNAYTYGFSVSSTNAMEIILYDENLEEISISPMSTNAGCQLDFSYYLSQGTYFLQTNYLDETASGKISITIRGEPHTHSYNYQYKSYDSIYHRAICACGAHTLKPHVARVNDGNPIRRCIICNAIISNGGSLTLNALQAQYVTINGSFIAPNGIIYLVDEDLDAYFDGTLVFFFNQPITSNTVQIYGEGLFIN